MKMKMNTIPDSSIKLILRDLDSKLYMYIYICLQTIEFLVSKVETQVSDKG